MSSNADSGGNDVDDEDVVDELALDGEELAGPLLAEELVPAADCAVVDGDPAAVEDEELHPLSAPTASAADTATVTVLCVMVMPTFAPL